MNQRRRMSRFKTATGRYDSIRALHIAQHIASGKSTSNVTIGGVPVQTELKHPKRRRVNNITAR